MVSFPTCSLFSWIQSTQYSLKRRQAGRVVCTAGVDILEKRKSLALPGSK